MPTSFSVLPLYVITPLIHSQASVMANRLSEAAQRNALLFKYQFAILKVPRISKITSQSLKTIQIPLSALV